jgi:LysR family transcriptional regulator for bpeEF and oprC
MRSQVAEDGFGIAQTVCFLAADGITRGRLVRLLKEWEVPAPSISILYARNRYPPGRVRLVMDFVASLVEECLTKTRDILEAAPEWREPANRARAGSARR